MSEGDERRCQVPMIKRQDSLLKIIEACRKTPQFDQVNPVLLEDQAFKRALNESDYCQAVTNLCQILETKSAHSKLPTIGCQKKFIKESKFDQKSKLESEILKEIEERISNEAEMLLKKQKSQTDNGSKELKNLDLQSGQQSNKTDQVRRVSQCLEKMEIMLMNSRKYAEKDVDSCVKLKKMLQSNSELSEPLLLRLEEVIRKKVDAELDEIDLKIIEEKYLERNQSHKNSDDIIATMFETKQDQTSKTNETAIYNEDIIGLENLSLGKESIKIPNDHQGNSLMANQDLNQEGKSGEERSHKLSSTLPFIFKIPQLPRLSSTMNLPNPTSTQQQDIGNNSWKNPTQAPKFEVMAQSNSTNRTDSNLAKLIYTSNQVKKEHDRNILIKHENSRKQQTNWQAPSHPTSKSELGSSEVTQLATRKIFTVPKQATLQGSPCPLTMPTRIQLKHSIEAKSNVQLVNQIVDSKNQLTVPERIEIKPQLPKQDQKFVQLNLASKALLDGTQSQTQDKPKNTTSPPTVEKSPLLENVETRQLHEVDTSNAWRKDAREALIKSILQIEEKAFKNSQSQEIYLNFFRNMFSFAKKSVDEINEKPKLQVQIVETKTVEDLKTLLNNEPPLVAEKVMKDWKDIDKEISRLLNKVQLEDDQPSKDINLPPDDFEDSMNKLINRCRH